MAMVFWAQETYLSLPAAGYVLLLILDAMGKSLALIPILTAMALLVLATLPGLPPVG
jgi:hypothetical protein